MVKAGVAYGLFYCGKDAAAVQAELPSARKAAVVPKGLVLKLTEGLGELRDLRLAPFVRQAEQAGLDFVLAATCPGLSNEKTASELADVFNMLYQSSLYQSGESLRAEVVYDNGKEYVTFD